MGNCQTCGYGRGDELLLDDDNLYFFQDGNLWHNRTDEIIAYKDSEWLKQVVD
jgi:ligand-binding sensor domain-containing protein